MKDTSRTDDWRLLCGQVSKESDPQKLLGLIRKINRALQEYHHSSRPDELLSKVDTVLLPINKSSQYDFDLSRLPEECAAGIEAAIEYDS